MKNKTLPYLTGRFFDGISSGLFMLALPWLMLKEPNMGTFVALTALVCTSISFIVTPFFATVIDRQSRKLILISAQVVQASTAALIMLAYTLDLGNMWLLALSQLIFWVSSNVAWHTNNAFTQENYDKNEYAKISSYQEIVMQGTTLGAGALGIVLLEMWGMFEFSLFAAIASSIASICYYFTPYRKQIRTTKRVAFIEQLKESKTIFSQNLTFYAFILLSCLAYPTLTFLGKLVPIWFAAQSVSGDWVAWYNMAFGLGSLLTGVFVAKILNIASHPRIMQFSMLSLTVVLILMASFMQPIYIVALTLGFGFFNALIRIARTNWMHHKVDISQRGRVDGGLGMFATSVQSLSYVLIAFLAHTNNIENGFIIIAAVIAIATISMTLLSNKLGLEPEGSGTTIQPVKAE
ncbi:MFS transporter [Vibrio kagoshimensis]|uniref:MFS transporter n=1 Tax=Vibrio kagoshimensis TaxID=2910244 RepID=UPI003D23AEDD